MTTAIINVGQRSTSISVDATSDGIEGGSTDLPCGVLSLRERHLASDPPLPQELTNAIGEMLDHLDDAMRDVPALVDAGTVSIGGHFVAVIADVENGAHIDAPAFTLTRAACEDVFRTLATEPASARRLNPGLPADDVDDIVAACCAVVAIFRGLHLDAVEVPLGARR